MMIGTSSRDFAASNRPRKPGLWVIFLVSAAALMCIVLAIIEAIQVFKPNLNIPPLRNRRITHHFIKENETAALNIKRSPSNKDSEENHDFFPVYQNFMFPNPASSLERKANEAFILGAMASRELIQLYDSDSLSSTPCPSSISRVFGKDSGLFFVGVPCGIEFRSVITMKAQPVPKDDKDLNVQFVIEFLSSVEDESGEATRIFHFNPRLRGDYSGEPVMELNTAYRGNWGVAQRCMQNRSFPWSNRVDGQVPCEGWREFPFVENRMFELKIENGLEGYHIFVDRRPVASFPHRPGFPLNDILSISVKEDIQVENIDAYSLPSIAQTISLGKLAVQRQDPKAQTILQPSGHPHIFVGIISASNNFAQRMAIRRTWLRSHTIQASFQAAAFFFVALDIDKDINVQLKKESDYYGDMVILPYIDHYHLLVLKTLAIVEFGVKNMSSKYIMKCDDDTYVNMDAVVNKLNETGDKQSLFMGLFNWGQGPEREGKWAVTYEEWPDMLYPPYANGPAYIISKDIGEFIISSHKNHSLEIFKMEDVSMGIWVLKYNETMVKLGQELGVRYEDNWRFSQSGCTEGYLSAHYQSPRQMLCLWEKLNVGSSQCCHI
ncbi:hydroxyproline O-galactosyltransferase GALT4 isoform X1 [Cryptomeria japonica]|uniref:hydroxyproline O-galactosyltransferase GALT4 isoform X1 n=2 Tax=Cryptomeria japonica TaxID=3369 RepID=UPI0027D9E9AC|nr:hydroxyproline O-galactosyltransferase GALT4 isoform X1 [Cryptomeria japonica]